METSFPYQLIEDASLFTDETLVRLKQIVDRYPCFSVAKILYLKNLAVLNDPIFPSELKRLAISIPDRRKLFLLIEDKLPHQSSITMVKEEERTDAFGLIEEFLSSQQTSTSSDLNDLLLNSSVSSDYIYWSMSKQTKSEEPETAKLEHHQLIDSFIAEDEKRPRRLSLMSDSESDKQVDQPDEALEPDFLKPQDDSFFTETLAQIYIKQKRYERALQIIEKLSLKYPEKNVYFADQIRFLEKLIINNKNIK
ncbi:hypothetical protein [Massilibacteroides sp.]|uniref:hypothetical protein n=1 Tax=Massilibacteroides sp. TaxID=2034766 RepID=UPI00261293EA|nr:hypothetical protein [Massilibacteroides sp.]MDD4514148.1 hypothetical protein [Massilibacteroides sp.]